MTTISFTGIPGRGTRRRTRTEVRPEVLRPYHWRTLAALLFVVGLVTASASCSSSHNENATTGSVTTTETITSPSDEVSISAKPDANTACGIITTKVIALADFPVHVSKVDAQSKVEAGLAYCTFGDEPDPKLMSISSLILITTTPNFLRAHHLSAHDLATSDRLDCVAGSSRELGPREGLGTFAFFCVGKPGSVRGAWIQDGDLYHLSYYSPADAQRAVTDRLDRFEAMARAISGNVPR